MKNKIAKTKEDFELGILKGKTIFPFGYPGKKQMTMNTPAGVVPYPIQYQGITDGKVTDEGIAFPGDDFIVNGDTVIENKINMNSYFNDLKQLRNNTFNKYKSKKKQLGGIIEPSVEEEDELINEPEMSEDELENQIEDAETEEQEEINNIDIDKLKSDITEKFLNSTKFTPKELSKNLNIDYVQNKDMIDNLQSNLNSIINGISQNEIDIEDEEQLNKFIETSGVLESPEIKQYYQQEKPENEMRYKNYPKAQKGLNVNKGAFNENIIDFDNYKDYTPEQWGDMVRRMKDPYQRIFKSFIPDNTQTPSVGDPFFNPRLESNKEEMNFDHMQKRYKDKFNKTHLNVPKGQMGMNVGQKDPFGGYETPTKQTMPNSFDSFKSRLKNFNPSMMMRENFYKSPSVNSFINPDSMPNVDPLLKSQYRKLMQDIKAPAYTDNPDWYRKERMKKQAGGYATSYMGGIPVGDELSGNTLPSKYFDNTRNYKSQPGVSDFMGKSMFYGQTGGYVDDVYPTAEPNFKRNIGYGRNYNYDWNIDEVGGYGNDAYKYQTGGYKSKAGQGAVNRYNERYMFPGFKPSEGAKYIIKTERGRPSQKDSADYDFNYNYFLEHPDLEKERSKMSDYLVRTDNAEEKNPELYRWVLNRWNAALDAGLQRDKLNRENKKQTGGPVKYKPGQVIKYKSGGKIKQGVVDSYDPMSGKIKLR